MRKLVAALAALALACGGGEGDPTPPTPPPVNDTPRVNDAPPANEASPVDDAPAWAGVYAGEIALGAATCSDGSTLSASTDEVHLRVSAVDFDVVQLTELDEEDPCPVPMDVTATTATVRRTVCPAEPTDDGTGTFVLTFTGGSMALAPPRITGTLELSVAYSNPAATCTASATLSLQR